jgi:ABC-type transport system substrate-binding protein
VKKLIFSIILALITLGQHYQSVGETVSLPQGELWIVDKSHNNWSSVTFNVFEHLIELEKDGTLVPRLAASWRWLDDRTLEFTLRERVTFHNGEVFDAEIVKLNWEENIRLRQPYLSGNYLNFKPGSRLEILDAHTVRFLFPEPDGGALVKLGVMHIANRQFYREQGWGEKHW